jgi:hypothetical protein
MLIKTKIKELKSSFISKLNNKGIVSLIVDKCGFRNLEFIIILLNIANLIKDLLEISFDNF